MLAADRITVKIAETFPAFPSVTVAPPIRSDGGVEVPPSFKGTETVFEPVFVTARSERPSRLKSPVVIALCDEPTGYVPPFVMVAFPLPSIRLTVSVSPSDVTVELTPLHGSRPQPLPNGWCPCPKCYSGR